jgi:hypothetical protein
MLAPVMLEFDNYLAIYNLSTLQQQFLPQND